MTNNSDHSRLIEDYLSGNISEKGRAELESRMTTDPSVRSEFELQKDILTVIRNTRRAELKSSLASVHIPWYHLIPTGWKIVATAGMVTATTFGAFYFFNGQPDNQTAPVEITDTQSVENPAPMNDVVPLAPGNKKDNSAGVIKPIIKEENTAETDENLPAESGKTTVDNNKNVAGQPDEINIPQPDMDQSAGENEDKDLIAGEQTDFENISPKIEDKVLAVKTVKSKEYNFHYTFTEGSLRLYGNFTGNPYKILEVNSSGAKEYYLYYNAHYFYLKQNTRDIKPLKQVTDSELVNELDVLRNNK